MVIQVERGHFRGRARMVFGEGGFLALICSFVFALRAYAPVGSLGLSIAPRAPSSQPRHQSQPSRSLPANGPFLFRQRASNSCMLPRHFTTKALQ
jgi:hypothetical protein